MSIAENIQRLKDEVQEICIRQGIEYPVKIIAVTKTRSAEEVISAINAGMTRIGENRVQEAEQKFAEMGEVVVQKRLIGHLQENKANKAAVLFDTVDSLDSLKTARRLDCKCAEIGKKMEVLVEVNTSGEASKNGLQEPEVAGFLNGLQEMTHLDVKGFMTIGPWNADEAANRAAFRQLYRIREVMRKEFPAMKLEELSMGMSGDYAWAIEEGSTMIRPGTLLFGTRQY